MSPQCCSAGCRVPGAGCRVLGAAAGAAPSTQVLQRRVLTHAEDFIKTL